jgi:hypothetical protein
MIVTNQQETLARLEELRLEEMEMEMQEPTAMMKTFRNRVIIDQGGLVIGVIPEKEIMEMILQDDLLLKELVGQVRILRLEEMAMVDPRAAVLQELAHTMDTHT